MVPPALHTKMVEVARELRKVSTSSEQRLWMALRGRQLGGRKFRRQQPIGPFVVDFFCAAERLIVEVDGSIHASQQDLDRQRQALLETLRLRFLRVSADRVEHDLETVLIEITATFAQDDNGPSPPEPLSQNGERGNRTDPAPLSPLGRGAGGEGDRGRQ